MENILFSNTPAEELNKLVRTKIAEHLFLICHYEPCVNVFSEDAKFVAGCLNLYKAVIDSSGTIATGDTVLRDLFSLFPAYIREGDPISPSPVRSHCSFSPHTQG